MLRPLMINTRGHRLFTTSLVNIHEAPELQRDRDSLLSVYPGLEASSHLSQSRQSITTIPHEGLTSKNETWLRVQSAIMDAFQGRHIEGLTEVLGCIRELVGSEVGPFIYDFYQNQMLKKGMMYIKQNLHDLEGPPLISMLESIWDQFYRRTLNDVKLILYPIQTKDFTIEELTLLAFRKRILLKTEIRPTLKEMQEFHESPSRLLQQMFAVLQGVNESSPPSDEDLEFEELTAIVLQPYLGIKGLYLDGDKVSYAASEEVYRKRPKDNRIGDRGRFATRQFSYDSAFMITRRQKNSTIFRRRRKETAIARPSLKFHVPMHEEG